MAQLAFHKTIIHGLEMYALYCKKDPIVIAWVHFYKYIDFSS